MKLNRILIQTLFGMSMASAVHAQVELTVTGSTAFRSINFDRIPVLFDVGSIQSNVTNANLRTYSGTISNVVPALGKTQVTIRTAFSGSAAGMLAVQNQALLAALEINGSSVNKVADMAFSDVYPGAASPPIPASAFDRTEVGVVPFVFVRNNQGTDGINNITRDQAVLLMTASGDNGMPASYLGGNSTNAIYLIGRDSGSGTRITTEKVIGFLGSPILWATNSAGKLVTTNGFSSGSSVRGVLGTVPSTIGYLGLGDYSAITNAATATSYNGVAFNPANVADGGYALWGYEHVVNRTGGLSANQALVANALVQAIKDKAFQSTNLLYSASFVPLDMMQVQRGADGGPITLLKF
jgi:hypothetical protein